MVLSNTDMVNLGYAWKGFGSVGFPLQLRSLSGPCHFRPRAAGIRSQDPLLPLVRGDPKTPTRSARYLAVV